MAHKLIGITCSTAPENEKNGPRQFLNRAYVWAVERAGGVPVILPVLRDNTGAERVLGALDGLLLSGGADVAAYHYGETQHEKVDGVDEERDATELALLKVALAQDMPIFGICRGIQVLNVAMGGTLIQDLPSQAPSSIAHRQSDNNIPRNCPSHPIRIVSDSRLRRIVGVGEMQTNSFHHQAIKNLAPGLVVTATAPDNVIEAVEGPNHRYLLAVQFHPEETAPNDEKSRRLFEAFVAAT